MYKLTENPTYFHWPFRYLAVIFYHPLTSLEIAKPHPLSDNHEPAGSTEAVQLIGECCYSLYLFQLQPTKVFEQILVGDGPLLWKRLSLSCNPDSSSCSKQYRAIRPCSEPHESTWSGCTVPLVQRLLPPPAGHMEAAEASEISVRFFNTQSVTSQKTPSSSSSPYELEFSNWSPFHIQIQINIILLPTHSS